MWVWILTSAWLCGVLQGVCRGSHLAWLQWKHMNRFSISNLQKLAFHGVTEPPSTAPLGLFWSLLWSYGWLSWPSGLSGQQWERVMAFTRSVNQMSLDWAFEWSWGFKAQVWQGPRRWMETGVCVSVVHIQAVNETERLCLPPSYDPACACEDPLMWNPLWSLTFMADLWRISLYSPLGASVWRL